MGVLGYQIEDSDNPSPVEQKLAETHAKCAELEKEIAALRKQVVDLIEANINAHPEMAARFG